MSENNWFCEHCQTEVLPEHVTFEETHDARCGGCGYPVITKKEYTDLKSQLQAANEQIGWMREKLDKARELFEDYHLIWCASAECGECTIDDCALRELGLLLYGYEADTRKEGEG